MEIEKDYEDVEREAIWMICQYFNVWAKDGGTYWRGCITGALQMLATTGVIDHKQSHALEDVVDEAAAQKLGPKYVRKQARRIFWEGVR